MKKPNEAADDILALMSARDKQWANVAHTGDGTPDRSDEDHVADEVRAGIRAYQVEVLLDLQDDVYNRHPNFGSDAEITAVFQEYENNWFDFLTRLSSRLPASYQDGLRDNFKAGAAFVFGLHLVQKVWPTWNPTDEVRATLIDSDRNKELETVRKMKI